MKFNFYAFVVFLIFLSHVVHARSVKLASLKDQVCASQLIISGTVTKTKVYEFGIQHLVKKPYTDFYTVAQINVDKILKGSLDKKNIQMHFRSHSKGSPFDYGDKYFVPTQDAKGIWYVTSTDPFMGFYGSANFLGFPLDVSKFKEVELLLKDCSTSSGR